jgi:cytochrome c553
MKYAILPALVAASAFVAAQVHAQADSATTEKAQVCEACHGPNGNSTNPQYPILAGQTARYMYLELEDFKAGRRHDPQMDPIAKNLTPDDMLALADSFSKQQKAPTGFQADPAKVEAGAKKSQEVLCTMCHGGGFMGQNEIPRVAGQQDAYVKKELSDFKTRTRTNDGGSMTSVASTLSDQDIENLAQYIANL